MHECTRVTVFILYRSPVFAFGVRACLIEDPGIQIVGMEPKSRRALEVARSLHPDVLVLEEPQSEFASLATLLDIPAARAVVTLSLGHNWISVYQARRLPLEEWADLPLAIRGVAPRDKGCSTPLVTSQA
jgi:chemotaxis response regulator CheB